MGTVSTGNAEHYRWGQACDGWHLLAGSDLSVIEERMPPGAAEVRHRHQRARQFFYVLEGELTLELAGTLHRLQARQGLHVPPGEAHQARNEAASDTHFLVISSPRSHGDRFDAPAGDTP
ncbi:cupin domain-containing protein [Dyella sp. ASV21]|jgi:mannose-6-phosphate isomerase-like protein (cupin superfamily)|uniref:cupin domain-containing protein n=1 Tax=Dyella sp. ASV21 TaxID=2795114 RepID=UPI0018EAFCCC|nr:cupin domain-containing protein [Dyella sp. ASV21]